MQSLAELYQKKIILLLLLLFAPKCRFYCLNQVGQPMSSSWEAAMKFRLPRKLAVNSYEVLRRDWMATMATSRL